MTDRLLYKAIRIGKIIKDIENDMPHTVELMEALSKVSFAMGDFCLEMGKYEIAKRRREETEESGQSEEMEKE